MKKIISLIIGMAISGLLSGQTSVNFGYDAAGNRISRTIVWDETTVDTTLLVNDSTFTKETLAGKNAPEKQTTSIGGKEIEVYPNPSGGFFKIKIKGWTKQSGGEVKLFGLQGNTVVRQPLSGALTEIRFHDQPDGTYLLTISLDGKEATWKIIKR